MENFDTSLCSHKTVNGDNYGESCSICNAQLKGYGWGGFFGSNLTGAEICLHGQFVKVESGENEYCAFCGKSKEQIEQLKIIESEAVN